MAAVAANLVVKLGGDPSGAIKAIDATERRVHSFVGGVGKVAGGFLLANVVQGVGRAVSGLGGEVLGFGAQMANVDSIALTTGNQLEHLKSQIVGIGLDPRIAQGPAELAAGLYDVQSSGFQGADGLRVLEQAALAATAGVTQTATAGKVIAGNLNAFELGADQARRVSDVLFMTVQDGVITFDQLANNMGNTSALADSLGLQIEDLGASYALMTKKNIGASQAETQIAALMRSAINPTESLTAAVGKHGYANAEAAIQAEGFAGFLKLLTEESGGSKEALFDMLGTSEAVNAALILGADGGKAYVKQLDRMNKAGKGLGATQKALERQMRSTDYQIGQIKKNIQLGAVLAFDLLGGSVDGVFTEIADLTRGGATFLHYLDHVVDGGSRATKSLDLLPEPLQRSARAFALVADGVADTVRAFQDGGLQGAIDELGRIQGDRILSGLETLGEEAWNAFAGAVEGAAEEGIDLAKLIVTGTLDLAPDVLGAATDLYGWFLDEIGLGDAFSGVGDGTQQREPITLGDIVVAAGLTLGGVAAEWAGDLWGWVQQQLGVGVGRGDVGAAAEAAGAVGVGSQMAEGIDFGDMIINAGLALAGTAEEYAGRLWEWVKEQLDLGTGGGGFTGVGAGSPMAEAITLDDVVIGIASFAKGEFADISTWLQEQYDLVTTSVHFENYTLYVDPPGNDADIKVDTEGIAAAIKRALDAEDFTAAAEADRPGYKAGQAYADAVWGFFADGWSEMWTDLTNGGGLLGALGVGSTPSQELGQGSADDRISRSMFGGLDITDTLQQTVDDFFQGIYDFVDTKLTGAEEWGDKISQRFTDKIMETPGLNLALVAGTALEALWNTPNSNLSAPFDAAKQAGMDILAQILDGLGAAFLGSDVGAEAEAAGAVGVGSQRGGGLSETLNEMVQGVFDDIDIIDVDWSTLTNPFEELGETVAGWVDIDWPEPPSIPEWIKDPWGWVRSQIKDGSSGENKARVGSGGGGMAEMLMSGVAGDIRNSMQGEGFTFNATFNITDNASAPLATVQAAADAFVGTYTGMLDATDFASTDIANVQAAADDLVGTYTVTINAEDNASDPLSNIASLVASIPDSKTITINTVTTGSPVPRATGGVVREPLTLVGERGPEVLSLPYGSRVHTAGATRGMLGMGGQTMRIDHRLTVDVRGKVDGADEQQLTTKVAQVVAQAWVQAETEAMRGQGL